jgi:hypothetical protein
MAGLAAPGKIRHQLEEQPPAPGIPRGGGSHLRWLIHTETWAGSRARDTTPARSSRTESRSTASFRRAANAATVVSASYRARSVKVGARHHAHFLTASRCRV